MDLSKNKTIKIEKISSQNRDEVNEFIISHWFSKDMVQLYYDSVSASRKLKSSIPMFGDFGIPIKHEIEFEMKLI